MDKEHLRRAVFKVLKKSKLIFNGLEWLTGRKDIRVQEEIHPKESLKDTLQIKKEKQLVKRDWR